MSVHSRLMKISSLSPQELETAIKDARSTRSTQALNNLLGGGFVGGAINRGAPLTRLNEQLKGYGLEGAAQTREENFQGAMGTQLGMASAGWGAGGLTAGLVNRSLQRKMPWNQLDDIGKATRGLSVLGAGALAVIPAAFAGGAAVEAHRANNLERRMRQAWEAQQG